MDEGLGEESAGGGTTQIRTGVPGLDHLLAGGLRAGGLHVLLGGPGAGKSVLAHQIGATLIRAGGKVLYLTALIEGHQTLIAQARTFRFFDPGMVPGSFYYASLYPTLAAGGLAAVAEEIRRLVMDHLPSLVVLDGVHALHVAARDPLEYQRFMHELETQSTLSGTTTLLLVHPPAGGIASDPTFTIADAILEIGFDEVRLRQVRFFSVSKLRGVAHVGGRHTFRITGDGLQVHPRVESLAAHMEGGAGDAAPGAAAPADDLGLAIRGMDAMLGGGIARNSTTLVVGTPGAGKTIVGLAFLCAGAQAGENGLLLGYHERPEVLVRKGEGVGLPVRRLAAEGRFRQSWRAPAELLVDEEVARLLALIERHQIKRLVIDAAEDLCRATIPREREPYVVAALANLLHERGVTTVVLHALRQIAGVNFELPMADSSGVMDNVVHLGYVEQRGERTRVVSVLKVRSRMHDHSLREFHIGEKGLSVGDPCDRLAVVLAREGLPG